MSCGMLLLYFLLCCVSRDASDWKLMGFTVLVFLGQGGRDKRWIDLLLTRRAGFFESASN